MSDYANVPEINSLYQEQANILQAVDILDDTGTIMTFRVAPTDQSVNPNALSITIATVSPSQQLLDACRTQMVTRYNDINIQLQSLGISNTPPDLS